VNAGNLSATDLTYDAHGNTAKLADQTLSYDVADRHLLTTLDDGTTVVYTRDATGRIVSRTATPPTGPAVITRYTYAGGGDGAYAVLDSTGALAERTLGLPGGVTVTITGTGDRTWLYPNLHGDVILTADDSGTRAASCSFYDPFGQPLDPTTGDLGTLTADDAGPDTLTGDADYGWLGQNMKITEHQSSIATIEMGARQYVAALGRFLEVDPIPGGNDNSYVYANDPINFIDITGLAQEDAAVLAASAAFGAAAGTWLAIAGSVAVVGVADSWNPTAIGVYAVAGAIAAVGLTLLMQQAIASWTAGVTEMAHRKKQPSKNAGRTGHGKEKEGKAPQKHEDAESHGGRVNPKVPSNPNKNRPATFVIGGSRFAF
jgi:RHS repeat-associated protein